MTELSQTLIDLPLGAWPYGRVAAVQDASIQQGVSRAVAANREATLAVLKALRVTVSLWPA